MGAIEAVLEKHTPIFLLFSPLGIVLRIKKEYNYNIIPRMRRALL